MSRHRSRPYERWIRNLPEIQDIPNSYLWIGQLRKIWLHVELESVERARERDAADEEGDEHDVGEGGREVDDLAARLDALEARLPDGKI